MIVGLQKINKGSYKWYEPNIFGRGHQKLISENIEIPIFQGFFTTILQQL